VVRRSRSERVIAGVCGGVGRYLGVDPVLLLDRLDPDLDELFWPVAVVAVGVAVMLAWPLRSRRS
jgi:PspC domain